MQKNHCTCPPIFLLSEAIYPLSYSRNAEIFNTRGFRTHRVHRREAGVPGPDRSLYG